MLYAAQLPSVVESFDILDSYSAPCSKVFIPAPSVTRDLRKFINLITPDTSCFDLKKILDVVSYYFAGHSISCLKQKN